MCGLVTNKYFAPINYKGKLIINLKSDKPLNYFLRYSSIKSLLLSVYTPQAQFVSFSLLFVPLFFHWFFFSRHNNEISEESADPCFWDHFGACFVLHGFQHLIHRIVLSFSLYVIFVSMFK